MKNNQSHTRTQRMRSALQGQMQYWKMYLSLKSRQMGLSGKMRQMTLIVSAVMMVAMLMAGFVLFNLVVLSVALIGALVSLFRPGRDPTFLMNFLTIERSDPYRHLIWTNNEYFQPPVGHSRPKKRRKH